MGERMAQRKGTVTDINVEFETMQGDELTPADLANATWKVAEIYFDLDENNEPCFTFRLEIHSVDMLNKPVTQEDVEDWKRQAADEEIGPWTQDEEGEEDA